MKRRPPIVLILLLLVAGAIVNVAVACVQPYVFGEKRQISWGDGTSTLEWELRSERGWPIRSLRTDRHESGATYFIRGGFDLPLIPIWPGFAINTVFYAVVLWLLFALGGTPFAWRRLRGGRRIKRGLCPKCAYPVGTNEVCTECGAAVATTKQERTP